MPLYRVMHWFQGVSQLPEDRYVNTFHFSITDPPNPAGLAALAANVKFFFNTASPPSTVPIVDIMASHVMGNGAGIKIYNITDQIKPRPVLYSETYDPVGGGASDPFPSEVSCVLSYRSLTTVGVDPKRTRGRLFIGPLLANTATNTTGQPSRLSNSAMSTIGIAGQALARRSFNAGTPWVVHSPTGGPNSAATIDECSVDNAFDIIRSRGEKATQRFKFLVAVP